MGETPSGVAGHVHTPMEQAPYKIPNCQGKSTATTLSLLSGLIAFSLFLDVPNSLERASSFHSKFTNLLDRAMPLANLMLS